MNLRVFYLTRRGLSDGYFLVNNDFGSKGKHFLAFYPTFGIQNKQKTKGYACSLISCLYIFFTITNTRCLSLIVKTPT